MRGSLVTEQLTLAPTRNSSFLVRFQIFHFIFHFSASSFRFVISPFRFMLSGFSFHFQISYWLFQFSSFLLSAFSIFYFRFQQLVVCGCKKHLLWSLYIGLVGPQCINMVAWIVVFVFSQKSPNRCSQLTLAPSRNPSFLVGFHIFRMSGCSSHRLSLSHQLRQSTPYNIKTFFTAKSLTTSDFRFPVLDSRFQT